MKSENYYNQNAKDFFENTIDVDLSEIYDKFLKYLPSKSSILDAGCGSGRDSNFFLKKGFNVTAFDASIEMVNKAKKVTGIEIQQMYFQDMNYQNEFDAVWSCASLLHVPRNEMELVFDKVIKSLKSHGIWYMSFKYGNDERIKDGRLFNDYNEESIKKLIKNFPTLDILEIWITKDNRPERDDKWINIICKNKESLI